MGLIKKVKSALGLKPKELPLISVVVHFRGPNPLSGERIHEAVSRAWGRHIREDLNEQIANKPPVCIVKFDGMILLLSNAAKPYCPPEYIEQALAEFPEMRQKKVVREHRAFLAIDLQHPKDPDKAEKNQCYQRMSRLAAEFIDENCMGVYFPETGHLRPYDDEVVMALRSEQPLREVQKWGKPPVMSIEDDDPRLLAMVAEARRRWPEFV